MTLRLPTLDAIEAAVWIELSRAARDRAHAWRMPVLATVSDEGLRPDARTVVLREVHEARHELIFFTDSRSDKVRQLKTHPDGMLVMWSPVLSWQLRCTVRLNVSTDGADVADRWERIRNSPAAQDYLSPLAPGAELDGTTVADNNGTHFAVVTATVVSIDWLEIDPKGHRRAVFEPGRHAWLQA